MESNTHLRDDDFKLVANIWWLKLNSDLKHRFQGYELDCFKMLLELYVAGDLPNEQSIRRCRRKLQELNPELRGELYDKRHDLESDVIDQVNSWGGEKKSSSVTGRIIDLFDGKVK